MSFQVGCRVRHSDRGSTGTVAYVGPLASSPSDGTWVGVVWDLNGENKSDGSVKGVRYFTCPPGKSGSMLRPAKLIPATSLLEALVDRFSVPDSTSREEQAQRYRTRGCDPFLRTEDGAFVNVKQLDCRASESLRCIGHAHPKVDGCVELIIDTAAEVESSSGMEENPMTDASNNNNNNNSEEKDLLSIPPPPLPAPSLTRWFPNLSLVNLTHAMLESWREVRLIAAALPSLQHFVVTGNRLGPIAPTEVLPNGQPWSSTVRVLYVAETGLSMMPCAQYILCAFPSLLEVSFGGNGWTEEQLVAWEESTQQKQSVVDDSEEEPSKWNTTETEKEEEKENAVIAAIATRTLTQLTKLHLNHNALHRLALVCRWLECVTTSRHGRRPPSSIELVLDTLNLTDNRIHSLTMLPNRTTFLSSSASPEQEHEGGCGGWFRSVTTLWLRGAQFQQWDDLFDHLMVAFPALTSLTFTDDALCNRTCPELPTFDSLQQFRFVVACLPRQIEKYNLSTLTEKEIAGSERMLITQYFPSYARWKQQQQTPERGSKEDAGAAHGGGGHEDEPAAAAADASDNNTTTTIFDVPAAAVLRLLERHWQEAKAMSESGTVFIPKPKYARDIFPVLVVPLFLSFEAMCAQRMADGFLATALAAKEDAERRSTTSSRPLAGQLDLDVRWTVRTLREQVAHVLGIPSLQDPMSNFTGVEEEHWTACQLALIAHSLPTAKTDQTKTYRLDHFVQRYGTLDNLFPRQSVLLFHVDLELAGNEGATAKGLHCKHLLRPDEKMYTHRIAAGDCVIAVVLS